MPGTPPQVTLKGDASNITTVEFRIFGFERQDTTIGAMTYSVLSLPGEPTLAGEGYPALPYIPRSLIIPDDAHMAVGVTSSTTEMVIPPVLPSRRVMWRNEVADTIPYVFASIYDIGGMYPDEPAGLGRPYILRDFRGSVLMACPFQHDPQSGLLRVHTLLTVDVEPDGPGIVNVKTIPRTGHSDPEFIATYQNQFLNYPGGGERNRLNPENGDLLIIAGDGFIELPVLGQFVEWKKKRGYNVYLHSVIELSGTTGDNLMEFVATEYTANANIAFVILVGNGDEDISTWPGSNGFHIPYPVDSWTSPDEEFVGAWPADNRCGMVEGDDARPDVMVSRMAAGEENSGVSIQELGLVVNRAVNYERNPYVDPSNNWYEHALFIASFLLDPNGERDWQCADRAASTMQETGYTPSKLYYDPDSLPGSNPVYPSYVEDELQFTGHSWLVFMGHGEPPVWYHYYSPGGGTSYTVFDRDDVLDLSNWGRLPFVFSVACKTGWIEPIYNPCLAKTWTIAGSGSPFVGGVGCFGSSSPQPIIPPKTALEAAVAMINDQNATTVGSICFSGLNAMIDGGTQPGCEEQKYLDRTSETWILFGDCSMQLRTQDPADLYVQHPTHVGTYQASGTVTIPVQVTNLGPNDEVVATLYWSDGQDEVHLVEILDQTQNEAQFQVDAQPARIYDLTVSGFNKLPYEATISLQETYSGVQSGNQTVHGAFLIDDDVCVQPSTTLNLERYSGSGGATFEIAQSCQGTNYGFNPSECEIVVQGGATLYAKEIHFKGEDSPSSTHYGTFSLSGSGGVLTLDGCTVEGGQNGVAMGGGGQLVRIRGYGGFDECIGSAIKCWSSGEIEVTDQGGFNNCDKGIELSGSGNITLTVAGSTSQMNGCFEGIYVRESPVVTASITGAYFHGCGTGIRIETGHSATAFAISDCQFQTNGDAIERTGIEVVGTGDNGPTVNASYCTFQSGAGNPDLLDRGIVYRDGAKGTISNCTFACGEEKYRAVECRSGNNSVVLMNNEFLGTLPCPGPLVIDNRGIYSLGGVANFPSIHANYFYKYCYGVSVTGGSLADLGTEEDTGDNEFWSNCCDLQYWGKRQVPPGGTLHAQGNCWNGYDNAPEYGILCGNWSDWIEWDPGWNCGGREFAPPSLPTAWALHVVGPTPCRESVEISLQIPELPHQREVDVKVMDLAGRVVRTLPLEEPQAGSCLLQWDGRGSDGTEVPSGVYVCRATVDGRVLSDKAILLREEP